MTVAAWIKISLAAGGISAVLTISALRRRGGTFPRYAVVADSAMVAVSALLTVLGVALWRD